MANSRRAGLRANLWKLQLSAFLFGLHFFSAVLVPFFTDWGHISLAQVMLLQSWFMFWIFALEIPTGAVADRFGRKTSIFLGLLVYGAGCFVYGSVPSFWIFLAGEFLMAAGNALISGADSAMLYDSLKALGRRGEAKSYFGRLESAKLAGILVASVAGSFIAGWLGLRYPMLATGIPRLAGALLVLTCAEPPGRAKQQNYLKTLFAGASLFARKKVLRILAFDAVSIAAVAYYVLWFYQPMLSKTGLPIIYFGFVHAGIVLGEILVSRNFSLLERLAGGRKNYLLYSALITGASLAGLAVARAPWLVMLFAALAGSFGLTRYTLILAYANRHMPSGQRATAISAMEMFRMGTIAVGNLAVGWLMAASKEWVLIGLGALAIGAAFLSRVEERHIRD